MQLSMRLLLPSEARSVPLVRKVLHDALGVLGVLGDCIDDVELAISEACTNVLDHAGKYDYEVTIGVDGERCSIEVADEGELLEHTPTPVPHGAVVDADSETGRGLQVMRALVDRLDFDLRDDHGTVVRMEKGLVYAGTPEYR